MRYRFIIKCFNMLANKKLKYLDVIMLKNTQLVRFKIKF